MTLETLLRTGLENHASDLHLEGGLPLTVRARGQLKAIGEPIAPQTLLALAKSLLPGEQWRQFLEQSSADLSRTVAGVRCRINVLRSARGIGFAIRILSAVQPTLNSFNLHPELGGLVQAQHGLVLVTGPTGSGKTSTLAALVQEINLRDSRHIITLESPIEYALAPKRSFIRQREIGRDSPSFRQALIDTLREDPDVIMVGEMRDPETMQLTLNAAETGHLVLASMHSSSGAEALQRLVAAFAPEIQAGVCAQLADCLVAVIAQRLVVHARSGALVAECEVLRGSTAVRAVIRQGGFAKLQTVMESGAGEGQMTWLRYREWLDRQPLVPVKSAPPPDDLVVTAVSSPAKTEPAAAPEGVMVIDGEEEDPEAILSTMMRRQK